MVISTRFADWNTDAAERGSQGGRGIDLVEAIVLAAANELDHPCKVDLFSYTAQQPAG